MSAAMLAAIQANDLQPALFVAATFKSETVYIWSGSGSVAWSGQTWSGLGALLSISVAEDGATVEARGITITFSGLNSSLLSEAIGDYQLGQPVIVYLGFFSAGALISSPVTAWAGRMDQPTIDVSADTASIAIACENRLLEMNNAVDRRYTLIDSQIDDAGDLGFQFVNGLQEMTLFWGRYPATGANV
jgi:hypothetical protein